MNTNSHVRPYTTLPEPYALASLLVWLDLTVASWTVVDGSELVLRCLVYGALLSGAAVHSWFIVRTRLWARETLSGFASIGWVLAIAGITVLVEAQGPSPWIGMIAVLQITLCSFVANAATLRLSLLGTFAVLIGMTPRLSLFSGGIAWVAFAVVSMFLLAYDRTAQAMGSLDFKRGEPRQTSRRVAAVSAVALATAIFFLVTPLVALIDFRGMMPSMPRRSSSTPSPPTAPRGNAGNQAEERGLGYGLGDTTTTTEPALSNVKVMRLVTNPIVTGPLYVRGQAFDMFDGVNWKNSQHDEHRIPIAAQREAGLQFERASMTPVERSDSIEQTYEMIASLDQIIFTVGRPYSVQFSRPEIDSVWASDDQVLRISGMHPTGSSYRVRSTNEVFSDQSLFNSRGFTNVGRYDLQIPEGHDRVASRAIEVTSRETTAYGKALAIERYLRGNFRYALRNDINGPRVVDDFLFNKREGHCALFASAMVVMLRSVGVSARYVTGFLAHDPGPDGSFMITGRDGHAWVEAYIDGTGWIAFDPTAAAANADGNGTQVASTREEARTLPGAREVGGLYGRKDTGQSGNGGGSQPGPNGQGGGSEFGGTNGQGQNGGQGGGNPGGSSSSPGNQGGTDLASGGGRGGIMLAPGGDTQLQGRQGGTPNGSTEVGAAQGGRGNARRGGETGPDRSAQQQSATGTTENGADRPPNPTAKKPVTRDPERDASDWRWLVAALAVVGTVGLGSFLFWQRSVGPAVERQRVRRAVPLTIEEDSDPRRFVVKVYETMTNGLGLIGMRKRESDTPNEFADAVARRDPEVARPVSELSRIFEVARYSAIPVTPGDAARARKAWTSVATVVRNSRVEAVQDEE